ncbi:MAG: hypothetical protein AVDCRST_MAG03-2369, partial [uncultured Rubrobacteraceae bacterium]
ARLGAPRKVLRPLQAPVRGQRPRRRAGPGHAPLGDRGGWHLRRARAGVVLRVVRPRRQGRDPRDGGGDPARTVGRAGAAPQARPRGDLPILRGRGRRRTTARRNVLGL